MTTSSHYDSIFRPGLFQGQIHVVTGGGSGIGRCVAHELAALGATVVITGRTQEKLDKVAAEIREDGGQVDTAAFDIRDEEQVKAAVARIVSTHGRIHGLVNNAGSGKWAPVDQTDDTLLDEVIDISLKAPFRFCREALAVMGPGSSIVNVGSTFGLLGGLDGGAYCAVKAGL